MALWKAVSSVNFSCWDGVKWWNLWSCHSRRNTGKFGWDVKEKGFLGEKRTLWFSDHFHWLNGHEFEQAPGVGDGQGSLEYCCPWGCKQSDPTEWLNWPNWCFFLLSQKNPDPRHLFQQFGWRLSFQIISEWLTLHICMIENSDYQIIGLEFRL